VIDLSTNTMYIDSFRDDGGGNYSHHIWALDITTGATKNTVQVAASIQGDSVDNVGGTITFAAKQQLQRAAVTLLNGVVYFAYAGYADTDPYHGWVLGYDAANLNLVKVWNDTPRNGLDSHEGEGGIWQAGAGLASDGTHLYLITGNGDYDASVGNYGDTILELTPDNSTQPTNKNGYGLSVVNNTTDTFTPFNEQTLADNDTDLGSGGPMLLPDQPGAHTHELVGGGKGGVIYLIDRDNFGGKHASDNSQIVGTASMAHATSSAAYFNGYIYYHAFGDVLKTYKITNGAMTPAPVATGATNYAFPGATPAVSSYGSSANGIVWETQYSTSNAVLRAYNAIPNGSSMTTLYSSGTALGAGVKFTVPTVADGRVYVGSSGALTVFGLLSNPSNAPAAPTGLTATASAVQGLQVQLSWTDNANNENAFRIERSTDGVNFTELNIASVNATTYTDTAVVSGTTYTYRLRATNPVGDSIISNTASATPVTTPPKTLYAFEDGSGTIAADSAGTNTGVLVGTTKPAWVGGRVGLGALSFSGNGLYNQSAQSAVQVSSNLVATLGTTSTLAAWIKTTQVGSNVHSEAPAITGVDQAGTTSDINWGTLNAAGQIGIFVGDAGGVYSTAAINNGQWHQVAITRDATTGQVQLFIDGVLNSSGTLAAGTKAAQFYLIGALTDRNSAGYVTGANYFNGQLDDVQIYNYVLSAGEISEIGQIPSPPSALSVSAVPDSGSMLQLSWTNTSAVAQNVAVERKTGAAGTFEQIATLYGTETGYIDTNLDAGTQYFYRVQAVGSAGASDYSNESSAIPPVPEILGHFIFYNTSNFDGQNGSSNVADGFALATDKQVLLPGETATFQNYSSYSKGINGIMIDITNFEGSITPDDYEIHVGNSNDPTTWDLAPDPSFVTQYPGFGVNGSIRLELVWDNNDIENEWVQVTLKANENTQLVEDDVFYFGNAIGDTGNSIANATVDATDVLGAQNNHTTTATITNLYDFNRDKVVDATDEAIAQANFSSSSPLLLITAPGGIHGSGAGLGNGATTPTAASPPDSGVVTTPVDTLVIAIPAPENFVTFATLKMATASLAIALTPDRPSSVDAVFEHLERATGQSESLTRLFNLEAMRRKAIRTFVDGTDIDHWLVSDGSPCIDEARVTDEPIGSEFRYLQSALKQKSLLARV
jgi:fibronectin type 3 domain-containing protein